MKRTASATWRGGLKDGKGLLTTQSGVLSDTPYSFGTRFEDGLGTNPEELIAAAHAGCFSMALAMMLGEAGIRPEQIDTTASVSLEQTGVDLPLPPCIWRCACGRPARIPRPLRWSLSGPRPGVQSARS